MRHGQTRMPEHHVWRGMLQRCTNPKTTSWHRYGGRGIAVCARWSESFVAFLEDMGPRPSDEYSLDRRDNDGPYSKENCRWATWAVQNSNKSTNVHLELDGIRRTLTEWAGTIGVTKQALRSRLRSDEWSLRDALTVAGRRPVRGEVHKLAKLTNAQAAEVIRRRLEGERLSVLAREFGVSEARVSKMARMCIEAEPRLADAIELRTRRAK